MSTTRHTPIEVITTDQRRRRWSPSEKAELVRRTYEPGMTVSLVARQEGVAASLLFQWRKLERQGALDRSVGWRGGGAGVGTRRGTRRDRQAAACARQEDP